MSRKKKRRGVPETRSKKVGAWYDVPVSELAAELLAGTGRFNTGSPRHDHLNRSSATYVYDSRRYLFDVKIPGMLGVVAIPVSLVMWCLGFLVPIAVVILIIGLYTAFNTFVARSYPYMVTLDNEKLSLESFGRTDTFLLSELQTLKVRENGKVLSTYVRLNGGGLLRGRYFVGCGDMHDEDGVRGEGLYRFFLWVEAVLDPENIRVRARHQAGVYNIPVASGKPACESSGESHDA